MSKLETSNDPSVVELRMLVKEFCVEAIQEDRVDWVLKNIATFLNENASSAKMAKQLTAYTFKAMGVIMERMIRHCGQPVGTWVSNEEGGGYRLETYCKHCGWVEKYGEIEREEAAPSAQGNGSTESSE
ncbi:hypothetical protein ABE504_25195 [Paenibacillus oryzisoli]|uniref:hypothetical protein n=1 Tax=Paenibacillus oryzisoli TaxID=1850517 RepID=UPI003D26D9E0